MTTYPDQETTIADDGPVNLPTAALAILQPDPAASVFHRLMLVSLAAIADPVTGDVGVVRDVELAQLLKIPGSITRPTRVWLMPRGHIVETVPASKGRAGTVRLGENLMRLASATNRADHHHQPSKKEKAA
ncbi:MAG TPA: hypothetical protein VII48_09100 [Rhizomicrobium sp.]